MARRELHRGWDLGGGDGEAREEFGRGEGVTQGAVRFAVDDPEVIAQVREVRRVMPSTSCQAHRAQRMPVPGQTDGGELGVEESDVEIRVVRDDRTPLQTVGEIPGDVPEFGGTRQHLVGDAMDVGWTGATPRIDEGLPAVLDRSVGSDEDDADLDRPRTPCR